MKTLAQTFEADGYLIIGEAVTEPDIVELEKHLASVSLDGVGTRNVLNADWCRQLSARVKLVPAIQEILPPDPVAIQCTYFQKTESENWLVALHRDLSIPIKSANRFARLESLVRKGRGAICPSARNGSEIHGGGASTP